MEIKGKKFFVMAAAGICLLFIIIGVVIFSGKKEEVVYKEIATEYGQLMVGIESDSSVDMETTVQSFELDISALIKKEDESSQSGQSQGQSMPMGQSMQPGGNMNGQMGGQMGGAFQFTLPTAGGLSYASQSAEVQVEEIAVSVGQKVKKGDLIVRLNKDSVDEIYNQLDTDLREAQNDLDSIENDQKASRLEAEQNYESNILYQKFAQMEYEEEIEGVEKEVTELTEEIEELQLTALENEEKLNEARLQYEEASAYSKNITETIDNMNVYDDPAWYASLEGTRIEATEHVYSLEKQISQLETALEQNNTELDSSMEKLEEAKRTLEQTKLSAKWEYDQRMLAGNTALESYNISMEYLNQESLEQRKAYDNAREKMDAFTEVIYDYGLYAQNSGVITDISIQAGDGITTGTELLTMYTENISLTASLEEAEALQVKEDSVVRVSLIAYPEKVFEGKVGEISDARYDSSTGKTYYDITVTIRADEEDFFQDMTGTVTFVTKETKEVVYVSNRAIFRQQNGSYVKTKDENGKMIKKEVITGFSDGINVEIKEGLNEGEMVLIESKVND